MLHTACLPTRLYPAPLVGQLLIGDEALGPAPRRRVLCALRPLGLGLLLPVHGVAAWGLGLKESCECEFGGDRLVGQVEICIACMT